MAMQVKRRDWLYVAGIVDGEGCIGLSKRTRSRSTPYICVSNTDPRLMTWLQERFGGNVRRNGPDHRNRKACYQWRLMSGQASEFIRKVRPFLIIKGNQADVVLAFRKLMAAPWVRVTPANQRQRDELIAQIHVLNKKGVA